MREYVKKDKHGEGIIEGEKFTFMFLEELHNPIKLIGSFDWNENDLRYEIDIHDNEEYVCLSFEGNGVMYDFELI